MRWNALAMVVRANQAYGELGGHIASYASAADLFEVGFNHFFRADDLVFYQPHSAPGVYARAFLEGRLTADDLAHYRRELGAVDAGARGLSSYPHPWLMPDFWQFPTGSMGLGPIASIHHARFMRYLEHRGLAGHATRPHGVGRVRRRRDGRAGEHERADARRARAARQPRSGSSTATCSGSTVRCAATAASSTSSRRSSPAPAGASSSSCGDRTGTRCSRATRAAHWPRRSPRPSTVSCRPSPRRTDATTASTSSAATPRSPRSRRR